MKIFSSGHKSLVRTLIWGLTLPTLLMIAITVVILTKKLSGAVKGMRQATLTSQADTVISHLSIGGDGQLILQLPEAIRELYNEPNNFSYVILDQAGKPLFTSHNLTSLDAIDPSRTEGEIDYFRIPGAKGRHSVYGASIGFRLAGQSYWIQVTQGSLHGDVVFDTVVEEFIETSGGIFIAVLIVLLAVNIIIIALSLRPLRTVQSQATEIGPSTTDIRLSEDRLPSEILPLVRAINQAFDRLEQGFQVQREFTANAAHELRTPLAVLTARIGKLSDRTEAEPLREDVRVMNRLVGQLLKVSQLEAISIGHDEQVDLANVAFEAATYLGPVAIENDRSISVVGADNPVPIPGNPELLGHAVRNLVENALHYTPPGTAVEITVSDKGLLSVSDEGPGIPEDQHRKVFQRFWRAERSDSGAGLGLAIVEGIVRAHGGEVSIINRLDGDGKPRGARFIIDLSNSVSGS